MFPRQHEVMFETFSKIFETTVLQMLSLRPIVRLNLVSTILWLTHKFQIKNDLTLETKTKKVILRKFYEFGPKVLKRDKKCLSTELNLKGL